MTPQLAGFLARNPGAYEAWLERERSPLGDRAALGLSTQSGRAWIDDVSSQVARLPVKPGETP
jgi:hypothetical protein